MTPQSEYDKLYAMLKKQYEEEAHKGPTIISTQQSHHIAYYDFEPAKVTIEIYDDIQFNAKKVTVRIGNIMQTVAVSLEAMVSWSAYEMRAYLKESFKDLIAVRPDVIQAIDSMIPVHYNEGGAIHASTSLGRNKALDNWKFLAEEVLCPVRGEYERLEYVIIFLNDKGGWTREQVADWLETLDTDITIGEKK